MKVARGQLLIGTHDESQRNRVFAVTALSRLQDGDSKAWLHAWDPSVEGDAREGEIVTWVRFPRGEVAAPWRILDIYDTVAMIERVERAMRVAWVQGATGNGSRPPDGLGLSALQALFAGPG